MQGGGGGRDYISPKINLNWLSYDIGCPKKM
jgi:hypothetical protein